LTTVTVRFDRHDEGHPGQWNRCFDPEGPATTQRVGRGANARSIE
jgi:hypothetical protein